MSAPTFSFYDWVRQIPGDVLHLDEIPLLGFPPPFPWEAFTAHLNRSLQIEGLKIQPSEWQWLPQNELFSGMGDLLHTLRFNVAPLSGLVAWVMPEKDIATLLSLLLAKNKKFFEGIDSDLLTSFYRFMAVETINSIEKMDFDKKLSIILLTDQSLPSGMSLCLDISILFQNETLRGRLILSPEFRKSWKERYLTRQADFAMHSPMAEKLNIIVHIEGGKTHITMSEWKNIHLGDVLILDSCSLDVGEDKGRVMLTINGAPFFRAKVKQGSIKILEHPLYHEVDTAMSKSPEEEEPEEEEFEEGEEEEEEFEDEDLEDTDEDVESEIEEEEEFAEFAEEEEEEKPPKPSAAPTPPSAKPSKEAPPPSTVEKKATGVSSIEEMAMPVVVEVGRIQMSVKQLMEMQPGNMLELNIHPENGVDLVVNGTCIAKGELLRIGDVLGIRILELF